MNNLTKRNIKILKILFDTGDYVSSIRLADELDISVRTIKSEIKSKLLLLVLNFNTLNIFNLKVI